MRRRLYRGVVKRACDDPGCDREWPCERHASQRELAEREQNWAERLPLGGMDARALYCREPTSVADECEIVRDIEPPDTTCDDCGYVVCACEREEPEARKIDWTMFRPSYELVEKLKTLEWKPEQKPEPVTANDVRVYCKDVLGSTAYVAKDPDNPGCWVVELVPEFKQVDVAERQVRAWKALRAAEAKRNADIVAAVYGPEMAK